MSAYKNFKTFYLEVAIRYWCRAFPKLVSYNRFVEWKPSMLIPLMAYLRSQLKRSTGIGFIDSTSLKVCHNRRIFSHKVFDLITKFKKGMKNKLMTMLDRQFLRKRAIVESVIDQLKNISQIEHTCHRSLPNFVVNLLAGLIAYCHRPKKPSIALDDLFLSASN